MMRMLILKSHRIWLSQQNFTWNTKFTRIVNKTYMSHRFRAFIRKVSILSIVEAFTELMLFGFTRTFSCRFFGGPRGFTSAFAFFDPGESALSCYTPLPHPQRFFLGLEDDSMCRSALGPLTLKWSSSSLMFLSNIGFKALKVGHLDFYIFPGVR